MPRSAIAPTRNELEYALEIVIRAALNDKTISYPVENMLGSKQLSTLSGADGLRVADVLIMLAGASLPGGQEWLALLNKHIEAEEEMLKEESLACV